MNIYVWILIAIHAVLMFGMMVSDEGKEAASIFISFLIFLPIFGRVLGWW